MLASLLEPQIRSIVRDTVGRVLAKQRATENSQAKQQADKYFLDLQKFRDDLVDL